MIIDEIIGDAGLADCYSSIDIFVLISDLGESFGMVIAESLLCETPVIIVATPWVDNSQGEVVGNQIGGYVAANLKDVPELIKKLIDDKALRGTFGKKGRDRIIQLFDARKVASDALTFAASNISITRPPDPFLMIMECTEGSRTCFQG